MKVVWYSSRPGGELLDSPPWLHGIAMAKWHRRQRARDGHRLPPHFDKAVPKVRKSQRATLSRQRFEFNRMFRNWRFYVSSGAHHEIERRELLGAPRRGPRGVR